MFRRKKKDEPTDAPAAEIAAAEATPVEQVEESTTAEMAAAEPPPPQTAPSPEPADPKGPVASGRRGNRVQKVGTVSSDKMQKTVIVRVDRQVLHPKYRRYVRRTSKFMAHDDLGATIGDRVRIIETRPLSAKKRWRVVEIVQKAAK